MARKTRARPGLSLSINVWGETQEDLVEELELVLAVLRERGPRDWFLAGARRSSSFNVRERRQPIAGASWHARDDETRKLFEEAMDRRRSG